jgi:hypothetical protein
VGPESKSVSDEILDDAGEFFWPVLGDERVAVPFTRFSSDLCGASPV